jgi:NTE family protein
VTGRAGEVVVVLSGGGAKAAAHAGAMRAVTEAGLVPSRFVATSMGATFAAMFAAGLSPDLVVERITGPAGQGIVQSDLLAMVKGLWARSILKAEPLREGLGRIVPVARFDQLRAPLTVTATDLDSGELTLFGAGGLDLPLIDALYASCALPLYYPPLVLKGRRYADGGLRAVLPLEVAARWPASLIVAVDVGPGFDEAPPATPTKLPPVVETHDEASGILMAGQTVLALALWHATPGRPPLVYIRPRVRKGTTFRADLVRYHVEEGHRSAKEALAHLKSTAG